MKSSASVRPQSSQPGPPILEDLIDEITNRIQAGEALDLDGWTAKYPEHAEAIRDLLPALQMMAGLSESGGPLPQAGPPEERTLGDFRIVREVGRGGMGVVYEAEQISLGRRVALKVLPFAATMDPRQLQRFQNEARAAASLDHPHIVHVHAVGCERAVHFYAMQFIDGQTLAAMIIDLRKRCGQPPLPEEQPTTPHFPGAPADTAEQAATSMDPVRPDAAYFHRVAEWGAQAAEALDHAHQLGIVHRDVKPANLLVDGRGELWVTDFGLAQVQSDTRVTMTGDLVGTLRYMSPEQALAQRVVVDHRTDVYSLGATLYELLTLEPAFAGNDRQELLRQIGFEEPRRPRKVCRHVPAELEVIVLKAMEKNPNERYATAKELADDLRRFLAHEPIKARPAGVWRRFRKWGDRNRAAVLASIPALAIVAIALGVGTVIAVAAYRSEAEQRRVADAAKAEALANLKEAEAQRQRKEASLGAWFQAAWIGDAFSTKLDPIEITDSDNEYILISAGRTLYHNAERDWMAGRHAEAEAQYRKATQVHERLAALRPEEPYLYAVSWSYAKLGKVLEELNRIPEAEQAYRSAVTSARQLNARFSHPQGKYWTPLDFALLLLARLMGAVGRFDEADDLYQQSYDVLEHKGQQSLGDDWANMLRSAGRPKRAEQVYDRLIASFEQGYSADSVQRENFRSSLAVIHLDRGDFLISIGRLKDAETSYRRSRDVLGPNDSSLERRLTVAKICIRLGDLLRDTGRAREGDDLCRAALANLRQLPETSRFWIQDGIRARLLICSRDSRFRDPALAAKLLQEAIDRDLKNKPNWSQSLLPHLGAAHYRTGDYRAAVEALTKARNSRAGWGYSEASEPASWRFFLPMALWQLGRREDALREYRTTDEWMRRCNPGDPECRWIRHEAATLLGIAD